MSKKDEALKLALEALEKMGRVMKQSPDTEKAIAAIREALVDSALDRMAENARDLGLDYEPPCKTGSQCTNKCQQCEHPAQQQEPFGYVTVRRLSQRFENHADQYWFHPAGQSPYLDNVDELHAVYTSPQTSKSRSDVKPLTDEQRQYVVEMWRGGNWTAGDIIDAVEAAHGIKGDA